MPLTPSSRLGFSLLAGPTLLLAYLLEWRFGTPGLAVAVLAVPPAVPRLRDTRLPVWLAPLLAVPAVNVVFAAVLAVVPGRLPEGPPSRLERLIPGTMLGSAVVAVVLTTAFALAITVLATTVLGDYGFALFVATPFCLGLFSSLVYGARERRDARDCARVGTVAVFVASLTLIAVAVEGAICIVMALPITMLLGVAGALVGYLIQSRGTRRPSAQVVSAAVLVLPALLGGESLQGREPPLRSVTTQIVVDAPPAVVWRHVVAVEPLPEQRELIFRLGIAYPTRAVIDGSGVGAVRRCSFSTGDFVEPITVWDPPRRLQFRVASQPPPMRELSPWGEIHPPHLDGFLSSKRGRFLLRPLPGNRTLLVGTTWYENRMWPQAYWAVWSDSLIHRIHLRVLRHVKAVSEVDRG
jgi:polyketide cyclase/dehydrase/lipid transport protein